MKHAEIIAGLEYIASSPPRAAGGFHQNAIATAKAALREILRVKAELERTKSKPVLRRGSKKP